MEKKLSKDLTFILTSKGIPLISNISDGVHSHCNCPFQIVISFDSFKQC